MYVHSAVSVIKDLVSASLSEGTYLCAWIGLFSSLAYVCSSNNQSFDFPTLSQPQLEEVALHSHLHVLTSYLLCAFQGRCDLDRLENPAVSLMLAIWFRQ